MSTPASEPEVQPVVDLLELPGQTALSSFRERLLTRRLERLDSDVKSVSARYVYFVELAAPLSTAERERLDALLLSGEPVGTLGETAVRRYIVPRPGTISPWSSKATDIARACDLDAVRRIERGIVYAVEFSRGADPEAIDALTGELHDRMIEAVLPDGTAAAALFESHAPEPLATVALGDAALIQYTIWDRRTNAAADLQFRFLLTRPNPRQLLGKRGQSKSRRLPDADEIERTNDDRTELSARYITATRRIDRHHHSRNRNIGLRLDAGRQMAPFFGHRNSVSSNLDETVFR